MKKILLIEDDPDILDLLEFMFQGNGYAVIRINREISIAEIIGINPHLIIIDFIRPHQLGNELCSEIKVNPRARHIPVILYSAANNLKEIADESGADAYIAKPFDIADFMNLANRLAL